MTPRLQGSRGEDRRDTQPLPSHRRSVITLAPFLTSSLPRC